MFFKKSHQQARADELAAMFNEHMGDSVSRAYRDQEYGYDGSLVVSEAGIIEVVVRLMEADQIKSAA
jgi:hypothetical protein